MKKQIRYIVSTLFLGGILSTACTGNFEKFNTLDGALTDDKAQMDNNLEHGTILYMRPMMEGIYFNNADIGTNWTWQTMQNLVADMFCGYFHDMNTDFFGNNTCYVMTDGWNKTNWEFTYQSSVPAINKSERDNVKSNPYMAVTKILKVATLHRISDYYGPICYKFNFEDPSGQGSSSQKEVYEQMFKDLDEALTLIDKVDKTSDAYKTGTYDILMRAGNRTLEGWARWANSLRLRLALRVSNVDRTMADNEAKKAFTNTYGLIETNAQMVEVSTEKGYTNPIGTVGWNWWEVYENASMESFLVGYDEPRAEAYFAPAAGGSGDEVNWPIQMNIEGKFKGIPMGITKDGDIPRKNQHYQFHARCKLTIDSPAPLMSAAEVWFLRAEAKLRGLTGATESVETCYKKGVTLSFEQWGVSGVTEYLESTKKPSDYVDAFKAERNMKAVSTITPKWDEGASQEVKLERIITQKWLAIYPEGCEAWAEQRRTGYPKLFKVLNNLSNGQIDTDIMIRRVPFPAALKTDQPALYQTLVEQLGGADTGGTRLWWDAGKNNF